MNLESLLAALREIQRDYPSLTTKSPIYLVSCRQPGPRITWHTMVERVTSDGKAITLHIQ